MPYLSHLLLTPGKETDVVALLSLRSVRRSPRRPASEDIADLQTDGHAADEVLPLEARRDLRAHLQELGARRTVAEQTGDDVELALINKEVAEIEREEKRATRLGGKSRSFQDEREKSRKSVSRAIDRARDTIRKAHAPLGRHLDAFVRPGLFCSYQPEPPTHWSR
jgi:hypothetical protein